MVGAPRSHPCYPARVCPCTQGPASPVASAARPPAALPARPGPRQHPGSWLHQGLGCTRALAAHGVMTAMGLGGVAGACPSPASGGASPGPRLPGHASSRAAEPCRRTCPRQVPRGGPAPLGVGALATSCRAWATQLATLAPGRGRRAEARGSRANRHGPGARGQPICARATPNGVLADGCIDRMPRGRHRVAP